jgi:hypothetical protein
LPARDVDERGDDEDLPAVPGDREEPPEDGEEAWPGSAPAPNEPMTFRGQDGRVHLMADMLPGNRHRAGDAPAAPLSAIQGLLRA